MQKNRSFVFTLNNPTGDDPKTTVGDYLVEKCNVKYVLIALEHAPTTGTPHLQGYLSFRTPRTLKSVLSYFEKAGVGHPWLAVARGTPEQNQDYINKEDTEPYEDGEPPHPGGRNDLRDIRDEVSNGASIESLIRNDMVVNAQQLAFAEKLQKYIEPKRTTEPHVAWYWGPTGSGKTRAAVEYAEKNFPGAWWISHGSLQWWDGYDGQKVVILDDIRADSCSFNMLLRYLDRYPVQVPVKGGFRQLRAEIIIVTCPVTPDQLYINPLQDATTDVKQLSRRIHELVPYEKDEEDQ